MKKYGPGPYNIQVYFEEVNMKAAVLYYSRTGHTKAMAEAIARGMELEEGMEAKTFSIEDIDGDWLRESSCIILGCPIYMASVPTEIKDWLDHSPLKKDMVGKLGGAFATADYIHGGGELGIQTILDHMLVMGMVVYSGGGSFGKPVIHLGPVSVNGISEDQSDTFEIYGRRMAIKTKELFG